MQGNVKAEQGRKDRERFWPTALGVVVALFLVCMVVGAATYLTIGDRLDLIDDDQSQLAEPTTGAVAEEVATAIPTSDETLTPQAGGWSVGDTYAPELGNTGYDVERYIIRLALDPAQKYIEGATVIKASSEVNGLAQLSLDFIGYEVKMVTVDDALAAFKREGDKLVIDLPTLKRAGAPFTLIVSYRGQPPEQPSRYLHFVSHLGLHYPEGDSIFAIAEPDGARYWFPANDHPRDKALFRFELTVPEGLTAVANGTLVQVEPAALPDGRLGRLFTWEHQSLMAPYLALVAVGQYERLDARSPDGIPLRHYVFPELEGQVREATADVGQAIDWLSRLLGPYPFENFGVVTARVSGGSMETQTMVLLSDGMIGRRTVVHELAHMWFGDWVSLDIWGEMWRNEGFATYFQILWENRDSPEDLELQMASLAGVVEGNDTDYPLDNPPPEHLFGLDIYFQGALAVHALRQEMGDDAFFAGLRTYFQRFGGGTADDVQFREVMEEAAGRPLNDYFAEWFPTG